MEGEEEKGGGRRDGRGGGGRVGKGEGAEGGRHRNTVTFRF